MTRKRQESATLADVIKQAIEARMTDVHVMLPGEFVSYDPLTGKASIKALIKRKLESGTLFELPLMDGVPVLMPRTAESTIYIPIKAGDKCMIMFAERSLDAWKTMGGSQDPQDRRKHHLSDAVAVPGLYSFAEPPLITANDVESIVIENKISRVRLKPDGKIKILNKTTQAELVNTVYTTLVDLIAEPFILNKSLFTLLKTQIETMLDLGA